MTDGRGIAVQGDSIGSILISGDNSIVRGIIRLAALPRPVLYTLWAETLPRLARRTRRDLLADLDARAPALAALDGEKAVAETYRAIRDVGCWWP